jgi:sodium transport system permease protein
MIWSNVRTVYAKELRDALRDRRAVISMFVVPTLVMPLLLLTAGAVMAKIVKKAQDEASPVAIVGGADSTQVVAALRADERLRIVATDGDYRRAIAEKRVRAAVELSAGFESALATGAPATATLHFNEGDLKSGFGVGELERFFREYRDRIVAQRLKERGLPEGFVRPFVLERRNAAPPEQVGGNLLGGIVPYVIVLLCFTGAMYPAIDLTAGRRSAARSRRCCAARWTARRWCWASSSLFSRRRWRRWPARWGRCSCVSCSPDRRCWPGPVPAPSRPVRRCGWTPSGWLAFS